MMTRRIIVGLSQYSRRAANRGRRYAIGDRKATSSAPKQPLVGGIGKKS